MKKKRKNVKTPIRGTINRSKERKEEASLSEDVRVVHSDVPDPHDG